MRAAVMLWQRAPTPLVLGYVLCAQHDMFVGRRVQKHDLSRLFPLVAHDAHSTHPYHHIRGHAHAYASQGWTRHRFSRSGS